MAEVHEGFLEWDGYRTWYQLVGDPASRSDRLPLVICHGGPGAAAYSCEPMAELAEDGRLVVLYDQLGCGRSQHLRDAPTSFWQLSLFTRELNALVRHLGIAAHYGVLGQSCGGMLALEHALEQPDGLAALVIADSMPSFPLWVQEANRLRAELPPGVDATLRRHEADGTTDDPEYQEACQVFYDRHLCRVAHPQCLITSDVEMGKDPTVYHAMNGPSEFHVIGNLKDWDIRERLGEIDVPTLLVSGRYDEATPKIQEVMLAGLPQSEWVLFEDSSHLPHIEEHDLWIATVGAFLQRFDERRPSLPS
jgi:L-proline amide hydrolase